MTNSPEEISIGEPINIDLSPFGQREIFKTFEGISAWAVRQIQGIDQSIPQHNIDQNLLEATQHIVKEINTLATEAVHKKRLTVKRKKDYRSEILGRLEQICRGDAFLPDSEMSTLLQPLFSRRGFSAAGAIAGAIGYPLSKLFDLYGPNFDTLRSVASTYHAGATLAGRLDTNYAYNRKLLLDLISQGNSGLAKQAKAFEAEVENRRMEAAVAVKEIAAARSAMHKVKNELIELKAAHESEMDQIRKVFEDELALKEPATYWTDKREKHLKAVAAGAAGFLILAVLGVYFMWNELPSIINSISGHLGGASEAGGTAETAKDILNGTKPSFFKGLSGLAVVTIPAVVFLWLLKLLARVFVENLHNMQDASQRSTMVITYLALLKDKSKPITNDERFLILDALFRPQAASGGDEGPPRWASGLLGRVGK